MNREKIQRQIVPKNIKCKIIEIFIKSNHFDQSRGKITMNSGSTIDLIKTGSGYSIIEGETIINKPSSTLIQNPSNVNNTSGKYSKVEKGPHIIAKKFIPQQTFTVYPYIDKKPVENHPYLIIPSRSQWFNLNSIHEIERRSLPEWFKQKKGLMNALNTAKFQKNQQLYKKYRNYIIELAKTNYVSATIARKGLAGDVCAIIRIHEFLEKWGLINFVHKKPLKGSQAQKDQPKINGIKGQNNPPFSKKKDGFDKDKAIIAKIYDKDDLQLLRKITKRMRPVCTSCDSLCGISWFEYKDTLTKKQFPVNQYDSTTTVVSHQQFEYVLTICFSCYVEKNYPVVLGVEDFTKRNIIEQIKKIDFDEMYGKKKNQEWLKAAQAVEKGRFAMGKCAQSLKMQEQELIDILMQMPISNLQKISRIDEQTQDEAQNQKVKHLQRENGVKGSTQKNKHDEVISGCTEDIKMFQSNLQTLDLEEKQIYEEFLQAWLMKIYTKLQQLEQWDKSIQWKMIENESVKRQNIAEKLIKSINFQEV